jgi:hypothetical protein
LALPNEERLSIFNAEGSAMKKILPLFFLCLCMMTSVFASFHASSSQTVVVSGKDANGRTVVTSPAIPAKSDTLSIPGWLSGTWQNDQGTFTFADGTIRYHGDFSAVGLDRFFTGSEFDLASLVSQGDAAIKVKKFWHRLQVTIYTTQGDISFLFVKGKNAIQVSNRLWRYRKETQDDGGYAMFRSAEKGTVGTFQKQ